MANLTFEPLAFEDIPSERRPSFVQALVPVLGMVAFLSVGVIALGLDPQIPLIWGIIFTGFVGRYWIGMSWEDMYVGIVNGLQMGMQAILILFVIYMLIATWIRAGTIPGLIYYGLELLTPQVFLPVTAVFAALVSFAVGSSWTTAGTLGVAFMGIGAGLGIPAPMTAGAILTGAYAGDKSSPLSDTTNLAAAVTNTDLMKHVRTMRVGTGIALAVSVAIYAILGLQASGAVPADHIDAIRSALAGTYELSPLVFLPLVVTFALALYGFPALPALVGGVVVGIGTMMAVQGLSFGAAWEVAQYGNLPETGMATIDENLSNKEGLSGSTWTITIIIAALSLGGLLERLGVLAVFAHTLAEHIQNVGHLTVSTAAAAVGMNVLTADQYMSIVVPGMGFRNLYDDYDLESSNLSRGVEAAGTTTSALIPWNTGGAYMAGVLGVPVVQYAPYYLLGFLAPTILIIMGVTGWRITYKNEVEESSPSKSVSSATTADDD